MFLFARLPTAVKEPICNENVTTPQPSWKHINLSIYPFFAAFIKLFDYKYMQNSTKSKCTKISMKSVFNHIKKNVLNMFLMPG